jgi:hypothetical protein
MVTVINRIRLRVPAEDLVADVEREFPAVFRAQPGFQAFYLVMTGNNEVTVIIVWESPDAAEAGAALIGPTLFNRYVSPRAESQDRVVGEVLVHAVA